MRSCFMNNKTDIEKRNYFVYFYQINHFLSHTEKGILCYILRFQLYLLTDVSPSWLVDSPYYLGPPSSLYLPAFMKNIFECYLSGAIEVLV